MTSLESRGLTKKIQRRRRPTNPANPSNPFAFDEPWHWLCREFSGSTCCIYGHACLSNAPPRFAPIFVLAVILLTITVGTTISDFMDRTLGLGLGTIGSSAVLAVMLVAVILYTMLREPLKNLKDC